MKCQMTELGLSPDGRQVRAITDSLGPQVVIGHDHDDNLLGPVLLSHEEAVVMGKGVVSGRVSIEGWRKPYDNFFEVLSHLV